MTTAQVWSTINCLKPHQSHQTRDAVTADLVPGIRQDDRNLPCPEKWSFQMQLIDQPHHDKIRFLHRLRFPIHGCTRHFQQHALPFDREVLVLAFNQFDPLRPAYFPSTRDKKSRSATNCPIV